MLLCMLTVFVVDLCRTLVSCEEVCSTPECKNVSQFIYSFLDTTFDPCEDMYTFACGGWIQNNAIPEGQGKWSLLDQMREKIRKQVIEILEEDGWELKGKQSMAVKKLKQFYQPCRDLQNIEEKASEQLKKLIDDHGSWTVTKTNREWNPETWNIQEVLLKSHKRMGSSFWDMHVDSDMLYSADKAKLTDYWKVETEVHIKDHYEKLTKNIVKLLGGNETEIEAKVSEVIQLENLLLEVYKLHRWGLETTTFEKLQNLMGEWINMEEYLEALFGKGVVSPKQWLIIYSQGYFEKLQDIINSTENEVLANYIMLNLLSSKNDYLHEDSSIIEVLTKKIDEKNKGLYYRQRKCLEQSRTFMKYVTSALYVDRHFSQETVVKVVTALDNIEREFITNLDLLTWLDEETKKHLKEKAESMTNHIGYPDWILDPIKLDAMYENLVVEEGEYALNVIHSVEFQANIKRKQPYEPEILNIWHQPPETVDAYYFYVINAIIVYAGILQEPILSKDYPMSYLYGTLGAILGHEIVHGFDSRGRNYDKYGNLTYHWTQNMSMEFNKRAKCFMDQYSNYKIYEEAINGYETLAENIADNGGHKLAYRAYKSSIGSMQPPLPHLNLTNDQLYFVGMSHLFCAKYTEKYALWTISNENQAFPKYRVIGSVSNIKEFAEAFNCPVNSTMNPMEKCEIW